jgi:hypothetical protein
MSESRFVIDTMKSCISRVSEWLQLHTSSTDIIIFQIYGDINLEDLFQNLRYIQPYIFPVSFCLAFNDLKIKFIQWNHVLVEWVNDCSWTLSK